MGARDYVGVRGDEDEDEEEGEGETEMRRHTDHLFNTKEVRRGACLHSDLNSWNTRMAETLGDVG